MDAPARRARRWRLAVPAGLAGLTVLLQIAYPLTGGDVRDSLTVLTVLVFAGAAASHAAATRGAAWAAAMVATTCGLGLLAEAVGTATGVPFGAYAYADSLGPKILDVPLVIPLAWTMFGYPCLLVGQRLFLRPVQAAAASAWALASWDLFLDPMMVAAGHWAFVHPTPALPGAPGIPLTNYAGWLLVAALMMGLLQALPRVHGTDDRVPAALFLWTWAGSVLANAVFLGRPAVALVGGVAMGAVALPYLRALRSDPALPHARADALHR